MATKGKLEGAIVIAAAINIDFNDGSARTAQLQAGTYYWSSVGDNVVDFPAHVAARFNAATSDVVTCTATLGEDGTGVCTLASDGVTFTVTWDAVSNPIRDLLGFETDGNLSGATSYTGSDHVRAAWIPDCEVVTERGNSTAGRYEVAASSQVAPDGTYRAMIGSSRQVNEITWPMITGAKTLIAEETTTNASYERFWLDYIVGEDDYAGAASKIRWYPDAADDATYYTYGASGSIQNMNISQVREGWIGRWAVTLPRLIKVE